MLTNGFDVAVMEHHVSSSAGGLTNVYSQARITYYGIGGIPESFFDGVTSVLGGGTGTYNSFVSKYNQRIAVPSNFTVGINGFNDGNDYTVLVTVDNVEPYTGTNIVLHFAVTESGFAYGGDVYNHVTRLLAPDQNGTPLDFTSGDSESVMLEFTISGWVIDNCEFIAFIQDNDSKEILQASKVAVPDLMPMYFDNAGCLAVNMVPLTNCTGDIEPTVTIANGGATNLTSVEVNYQVNEEDMNTYNWTGDLAYGETEQVTLPTVSFDILDENDLLIYTSNPNGNPDEDPLNDTTSTTFTSAVDVDPDIHLYLKLDDYPEETSWELINSAGEVLYSGGPYTEPQLFVQETLALTDDDCYTFYLYDTGGDGLASPGFYKLMDGNFGLIFENYNFNGVDESYQFAIDLVSVEESEELTAFSVFPNPFEDYTHISFVLEEKTNVDIVVYNVMGELVSSFESKSYEPGRHVETLNAESLNSGVYFVNVKIGDRNMTKKISLR